jgi:hypothetical protein
MTGVLEADVLEVIDSSADASGKAGELMEHHEAVEMMASERYLLDELTPELRDAYEEHMFGCTECANDVRFGAEFVDQAKAVLSEEAALPGMAAKKAPAAGKVVPVQKPESSQKPRKEKRDWFGWLRPGVMVPAFACLLAIVGYQNLIVYPALEASASEPRLLPPATVLAGETRGGVPIVYADLVTGSTVTVPLPPGGTYTSFKFDFYDSKGKLIWTHTMRGAGVADDTATIWLPGRIKQDSYKLAISGVTASGENIPLQQQFFELRTRK